MTLDVRTARRRCRLPNPFSYESDPEVKFSSETREYQQVVVTEHRPSSAP